MDLVTYKPVFSELDDAIQVGAKAGVARAARHDMRSLSDTLGSELPDDLQELLLEPLQSVHDQLIGERAVEATNPRFTELVSELVTVAAIARQSYGEAALSDPDITRFLEQAVWFLNSFRHA